MTSYNIRNKIHDHFFRQDCSWSRNYLYSCPRVRSGLLMNPESRILESGLRLSRGTSHNGPGYVPPRAQLYGQIARSQLFHAGFRCKSNWPGTSVHDVPLKQFTTTVHCFSLACTFSPLIEVSSVTVSWEFAAGTFAYATASHPLEVNSDST